MASNKEKIISEKPRKKPMKLSFGSIKSIQNEAKKVISVRLNKMVS